MTHKINFKKQWVKQKNLEFIVKVNSTLTSARLRLIRSTLNLFFFDSRCFGKPLFTQSQIVPSSNSQDVNWRCHTGKGNWFLSKIRNFRKRTHLYESSSKGKRHNWISGIVANKDAQVFHNFAGVERVGKWQQFVVRILLSDRLLVEL